MRERVCLSYETRNSGFDFVNIPDIINHARAADVLDNVMYEPEQFPGLIYRMKDPKTVLLLFASGKIVCTGAKSKEMVHESVAKVYEVLQDYDLLFNE